MIPATGSRGILQERCGKVTGSCKKTPEIAGTLKQYPGRNTASTKPPGTGSFRYGLFDLGYNILKSI